jgi:hypothetical protein
VASDGIGAVGGSIGAVGSRIGASAAGIGAHAMGSASFRRAPHFRQNLSVSSLNSRLHLGHRFMGRKAAARLAAARIQSGIAGQIKIRNTLSPLASKQIVGCRAS